jgi:phosphoribosylamine-glycine ligase
VNGVDTDTVKAMKGLQDYQQVVSGDEGWHGGSEDRGLGVGGASRRETAA